MSTENLYARRNKLQNELDGLRAEFERTQDSGILERLGNVKRGVDNVAREIVGELAKDPSHREGTEPVMRTTKKSAGSETRDAALRAVEARAADIDAPSGDRLVGLIEGDRFGLDAEYVAAVADPAYEAGFARQLMHPQGGAGGLLSPDEHSAVERVGRAMENRALAVGESASGGFAIPMTLDPTIMLSSDGAVNPIRELATVTPISTTHWRGVSSAGVTTEFVAEATEAVDGSPTLAGPEITPEKAQTFIPFSIESGEDWPALSSELARLLADAKNVKEGEIFVAGKGTEHVPQGLVTGSTKSVETATKEVMAPTDVFNLQNSLPARWQPKASFLGSLSVANKIYGMVGQGDPVNPKLMNEARDSILGKPFHEVSTMSAKPTVKKEKVLAYGDIRSAFRIIDRIGMRVELIQHLFGENQRPTGQRGLYGYFRVGSKVLIPEAVRVLVVKE